MNFRQWLEWGDMPTARAIAGGLLNLQSMFPDPQIKQLVRARDFRKLMELWGDAHNAGDERRTNELEYALQKVSPQLIDCVSRYGGDILSPENSDDYERVLSGQAACS
jgi:hypothetical protein